MGDAVRAMTDLASLEAVLSESEREWLEAQASRRGSVAMALAEAVRRAHLADRRRQALNALSGSSEPPSEAEIAEVVKEWTTGTKG